MTGRRKMVNFCVTYFHQDMSHPSPRPHGVLSLADTIILLPCREEMCNKQTTISQNFLARLLINFSLKQLCHSSLCSCRVKVITSVGKKEVLCKQCRQGEQMKLAVWTQSCSLLRRRTKLEAHEEKEQKFLKNAVYIYPPEPPSASGCIWKVNTHCFHWREKVTWQMNKLTINWS